MPETREEELLRQAKALAYALGITVFIRTDGRIYQHGGLPGDIQVEPPPGAHPEIAGRGTAAIEGASE
jgi:hypothetical protein